MNTGDLVVALYDEQRGFSGPVGMVLQSQPLPGLAEDVKVLWLSESNPIGWWRSDQLRVISSAS